MLRHFFIVGCQRSGTTLLRLVLETHSLIRCLDETRSYAALAGYLKLEADDKSVTGFKIPRWTEQLDARLLWDYGLPERAAGFYRGEPILFLIRDARDTVGSMLKLKAAGQSWLEHWASPILQAKATQDRSFARRYAAELRVVESAPIPRIAIAALYWKYKTAALLDYIEKGYPVMPLRYEDVTAEPGRRLRRVCSFLNVPWEEALLEHATSAHEEVFAGGLTVGDTDPKRAIDRSSVGQWTQFLSKSESAQIDQILGDLPSRIEAAIQSAARNQGRPESAVA